MWGMSGSRSATIARNTARPASQWEPASNRRFGKKKTNRRDSPVYNGDNFQDHSMSVLVFVVRCRWKQLKENHSVSFRFHQCIEDFIHQTFDRRFLLLRKERRKRRPYFHSDLC